MPQFEMDKSGEVLGLTFEELPPLTQGYIEALLFTETCSGISMVEWEEEENQEDVREGRADGSIPTDAGFGDIHPDSLKRIIADCGAFHVKARDLLRQAYECDYDATRAGHDFWYTRNGHGVGFWDRQELEPRDEYEALGSPRVDDPDWSKWQDIRENSIGNRLSAVARKYGELTVDFIADETSPTGYGFVHVT